MSAPPSNAPAIKYIPEDHERAYYQALFQVADTAGRGQIGGAEAVQFFTRSKLPIDTLKNIWTVADQPPSNYLDLPKFAVAVRLIQCTQNGHRGQGATLATPPGVVMRPPMFDGVSGVTVPLPPEPAAAAGGPPAPSASPTPMQQPPATPQQAPAPPQQQAPPSQPRMSPQPTQQQQQQRMSMMQQQQQMGSSTALTAQDPYSMAPSDFSRYEGLFPEYSKEDGFVYGAEAVALFSKSGMPQQALAAIWNMVDHPVDNRLDKVEFAIAMHLIVCISKKSLPMPPSLPNSLVQFKQQQSPQQPPQAAAAAAPPQPTPTPQPPAPSPVPPTTTDAAAAAALAEAADASAAAVLAQAAQPPPLGAAAGGMSISDAFEGLGTEPTMASDMMAAAPEVETVPPTAAVPEPAQPPHQFSEPAAAVPPPAVPAAAAPPAPTSMPAPTTTPTPAMEPAVAAATTTAAVAAAVGTSNGGSSSSSAELTQMRELLQKLQAENISLKAQLSGSTEDERDVQKELAITIAEVARLSSVLTGLRQQVAAQKTRFADLTATLKSAKDNAGLLNSLITEETATRDALEEANQTMMASAAANTAAAAAGGPALQAAPDMFAAAPPPPHPQAAAYGQSPPPAQGDLYGQPAPPPTAVTQVMDANSIEMTLDATAGPPAIPEVASNLERSVGAASPPAQPVASPGTVPGPYDYAQPVSAVPTMDNLPPSSGGNHNRNMSTTSAFGFNDGDFMGGEPLSSVAGGGSTMDFSSSASAAAATAQQKPPPPPKMDFEEMRRKAKEADAVARDAEENHRVLLAQVSEYRKAAEDAEAALTKQRRNSEVNKDKKKGLFGGGNKQQKKEAKLEQQMQLDAKAKKDELLQVQGRANDAQALAMETRRESDRLHRAVEEAEMAQASADSLQQAQPAAPPQAQPQQAPPPQQQQQQPPPPQPAAATLPPTVNGGMGIPEPTSQELPKSYYPPPQQQQQQPLPMTQAPLPPVQDGTMGGFQPNVMANSSDGFSIPDPPNYSAQTFDNPFAS